MSNFPDESVFSSIAALYVGKNGDYHDHFPEKVLEIIRTHKLFRCFLPVELNGGGLRLSDTLLVIEKCAYINGSLGWLIQIGNGGNYFAGYMNEKTSRELFSGADAVLAGSGAFTGTAIPVENGFRISGKWKYCSGSTFASFFTCSCKVEGSQQTISCAVLPGDVTVIDDWNTIGLRYTSTNSIRMQDVFVPHNRVFGLTERKSFFDVPVFDFPFLAYAQAFFLHTLYGMFSRFLTEAEHMAKTNATRWNAQYPNRAQVILDAVSAAKTFLAGSREEILRLTSLIERDTKDEELQSIYDRTTRHQNTMMRDIAANIFPLLGMEALYRTSATGVFYNDLLCCAQHSLLNDYSTAE